MFVSEPFNIRAMLPIKGKSLLLSINSPFEPGHVEKHPAVEDSMRRIVIDIIERNEIEIPKGKY